MLIQNDRRDFFPAQVIILSVNAIRCPRHNAFPCFKITRWPVNVLSDNDQHRSKAILRAAFESCFDQIVLSRLSPFGIWPAKPDSIVHLVNVRICVGMMLVLPSSWIDAARTN